MNWLTNPENIALALVAFCFGYPFVMSLYWISGALLFRLMRERLEPLADAPPALSSYPFVSVLVPCHNEERQAEETFSVLAKLVYPNFEIIAINDGSTDRTAALLESLCARIPSLRVVHLATNQGKSTALNVGGLMARGEILVCIDGDALLDRHALTWFVRRFLGDAALGALTGNPRIRNRASLLGRLQVGEFSSIVGLIKRAQTVYGSLFTVSGVICAFRKRALHDVGWWNPSAITDDVEVSWRIQLAGWRMVYEPKALCWILMPETLKGLWSQRVRWSEGGTRTVIDTTARLLKPGGLRMLPIWLNYVVSIVWSYTMMAACAGWLLIATGLLPPQSWFSFSMIPDWWGEVLGAIYMLQASISVMLDSRFEKNMGSSIFWIVWYPLVFWLLQTATAIAGVPKALSRARNARGTWTSPDRGFQ
ncbi:MAG: poly-beta-1,6-N-acetyl-D-glucosamine synthase [Rhodoferax sp.]